MENTPGQEFNKFALPIRWGVIISIVLIFMTTIHGLFLMESMGMVGIGVVSFLSFVIAMILLLVMGTQQRKAMGGYITFKEAFSAIFVSVLIIAVVSNIYTYAYTNWIDPSYFEKMKNITVNMTASIGGDEAAEMSAAEFDKNIERGKSFGGIMLGLATTIILYSLFGFIIAAIVKRNKPEHLQEA